MPEGYWAVMGQRVLFWGGWVFGVLGVVYGPSIAQQPAWIGAIVYAALLIPLGTHSWWVHKRLGEAERKHLANVEEMERKLAEEVTRREAAERQVTEVPAEVVARLTGLVGEGVVAEVVDGLRKQADLVTRLRRFVAALTKPLAVRSFEPRQGELYVVARGAPPALPYLHTGDEFRLVRRADSGVENTAARLVVHQPYERGDTVFIRVVGPVADDIAHLTGLAGDRPAVKMGEVRGRAGHRRGRSAGPRLRRRRPGPSALGGGPHSSGGG